MTFAADIEKAAEGEPIEAVAIGDMGWTGYGTDSRHAAALARKGDVLTWEEARPLLAFDYDTGHGAPDCMAIYAWTPTKVLFVVQYDGATGVESVPRHPVLCVPEMPGWLIPAGATP